MRSGNETAHTSMCVIARKANRALAKDAKYGPKYAGPPFVLL